MTTARFIKHGEMMYVLGMIGGYFTRGYLDRQYKQRMRVPPRVVK